MNQIVPPSFLFHYSLGMPREERLPGPRGSLIPAAVPPLMFPSSLNVQNQDLQLRAAWSEDGLAFSVIVKGKSMEPSGRWSQTANSDYLMFCIDTRHTANVHRATEFCLALRAMISDEDADGKPTLQSYEFAQRSARVALDVRRCRVEAKTLPNGYQLDLWLPSTQIPGYVDAIEIGHIGFYLMIHDTELGEIPLSVGGDFPVTHDPSTWIQLELLA